MKKLFAGLYVLLFLAGCTAMAVYPPAKIANVNDTELAYASAGQGVSVVFVHGAGADMRAWATQRDPIAGHYRFITYSLRYHEPNKWRDNGRLYSVQTHVEDLAAFIKSLNVGPVHLVGHSYGGQIAAEFALEHPELVKTLILEEAGIWTLLRDSDDDIAVLNDSYKVIPSVTEALAGGNSTEGVRLFADVVLGEKGGFDKLPPDAIDMLKANAKTMRPMLLQSAPPDINCGRVGTIKAPTLIVEGERTVAFYQVIDNILARCISGSDRVTIPGADHVIQLRKPDAFNQALLAFLAKHP